MIDMAILAVVGGLVAVMVVGPSIGSLGILAIFLGMVIGGGIGLFFSPGPWKTWCGSRVDPDGRRWKIIFGWLRFLANRWRS